MQILIAQIIKGVYGDMHGEHVICSNMYPLLGPAGVHVLTHN